MTIRFLDSGPQSAPSPTQSPPTQRQPRIRFLDEPTPREAPSAESMPSVFEFNPDLEERSFAPATAQKPSRYRTPLAPDKEPVFQEWYRSYSSQTGLNPDPDDPRHAYDYRGWWEAMQADPERFAPQVDPEDGRLHGPSLFKDDDHPNRYIKTPEGTLDSKTGQLVETTFGGNVAEAFRGIPKGAIQLGGTALKGAAAKLRGREREAIDLIDRLDRGEPVHQREDPVGLQLMLPEQRASLRARLAETVSVPLTETPIYQTGQAVSEYGAEVLPAAPGYEESVGRQIGEGFGSMTAGFVASVIPGAGPALFTLAGAGEAVERAVRDGATEDQIIRAADLGVIPGLTDSLPVETLLGRIPVPGGAVVTVPVKALGTALTAIRRIGWQAFIEGVQEGGQEFLQNLIAREIYKPEQELTEGISGSAGVGGGVGGIAATVKEIVLAPFRRRRTGAAGPAAPAAPTVSGAAVAPEPASAGAEPTPEPPALSSREELRQILEDERPIEEIAAEREVEAKAAEAASNRILGQFNLPAPGSDVTLAVPVGEGLLGAGVSQGRLVNAVERDGQPFIRVDVGGEIFLVRPDELIAPAPGSAEPVEEGAAPPPAPAFTGPAAVAASHPESVKWDPAEGIFSVDPDVIGIDAATFQFKESAETGDTGALEGIKKWDRRAAGVLLLFEDANGRLWVADGHQRILLAKRLKSEGQDVRVNAEILRAADGWTAADARGLAALKNIQEGSGTAVDIAKALRLDPSVLEDVPLNKGQNRDGVALSQLGDDAFGMVVNGMVPPNHAAHVGRAGLTPEQQVAALGLLAKAEPGNTNEARLLVDQIKAVGFTAAEQTDMFGTVQAAESLMPARVKILDFAKKSLRADRTTFKRLVDREADISEAGNVLATEANIARMSDDERLFAAIERLANRKGEISDALSEAARNFNNGTPIRQATRQFIVAIKDLERQATGREGEGAAGEGRGIPQPPAAVEPAPAPVAAPPPPPAPTPTQPKPTRRITPQVPPLAGMSPLGIKPAAPTRAERLERKTAEEKMAAAPETPSVPAAPAGDEDLLAIPEFLKRDAATAPPPAPIKREITMPRRRERPTKPAEAIKPIKQAQFNDAKDAVFVAADERGIELTEDQIEALARRHVDEKVPIDRLIDEISPKLSDEGEPPLIAEAAPLPTREARLERKRREQQAEAERRMAVKQRESKIRKGDQESLRDQKGGLFSAERDQTDLFGKPKLSIEKDLTADHVDAIRQWLRGELDRLGLTDVRLDLEEGRQERQLLETLKERGSTATVMGGAFTTERGMTGLIARIYVNPESPAPPRSLRHEVIHALRSMNVIEKNEWKILERAAKNEWRTKFNIDARYPNTSAALRNEEAVGDAFADYVAGTFQGKGRVRRIFEKIRQFIVALGNALRGNGFQTPETIFGKIQSGEIGNRPRRLGFTDETKLSFETRAEAEARAKELEDETGFLHSVYRTETAPGVKARFGVSTSLTKPETIGGTMSERAAESRRTFERLMGGQTKIPAPAEEVTTPQVQQPTTASPTEVERLRQESQEARIRQAAESGRQPEQLVLLSAEQREPGEQNNGPSNRVRQKRMLDWLKKGQPIDRAFRIPFDLFGGVDEKGQWKSGAKLMTAARKAIINSEFSENSRFSWANGIMHAARAGLIDRFGLSKEYITRERQIALDKRRIMVQGAEILKTLKEQNIGLAEAKVLQAILNGEEIPDAHWQRISAPIRQAIDDMGLAAVEVGYISRESYERNRGTYLHRVYMKHEADLNKLGAWVSKRAASRRKKIIGEEFKGRGLPPLETSIGRFMKDVPGFSEAKRGGPVKGEKFKLLQLSEETGELLQQAAGEKDFTQPRTLRKVWWPAGTAVPDRLRNFRDGGTFEVIRVTKDTVTVWRDYTKAERTRMGEILDARYTIAKTFSLLAHDLAVGKFYKDVSENNDWTRSTPPEAHWIDASEYKSRLWADRSIEWVKVTDSAIAKTGGKKRWGALAGKFVRAEIWRDLNEMMVLQNENIWQTALTQWKLNKTARSLVVHTNNIMSNLIFMDMADVRMQDLARGLHSFVNQTADYKNALKHGAFGSDIISQEIRRDVLEPLLKEIQTAMQGGQEQLEARFGLLGKLADTIWGNIRLREGTLLGKVDERMLTLYRLEDEVFRMATYTRRLALGDTPAEAADFARQQFLDYDIRAPWVNAARRSVLPFAGYTYRAVPVLARSIALHPWKYAKYLTIAYMATQAAYLLAGDDDDEPAERRSLREELQGITWILTPRMLRMPWLDSDGNPVFLDIRRWIPAGDIFDVTQGSAALGLIPAPLYFGGPILLAFEFLLNKSAFTGKAITNERTDDSWDKLSKVGDWAWKSWMPSTAWIPGSWYWSKIGRSWELPDALKPTWEAIGLNPNRGRDYGGVLYSFTEALASSLGIKIRPQDIAMGFENWGREFDRTERELKGEARRTDYDFERGLISASERDAQIAKNVRKHERLEIRKVETFLGPRARSLTEKFMAGKIGKDEFDKEMKPIIDQSVAAAKRRAERATEAQKRRAEEK